MSQTGSVYVDRSTLAAALECLYGSAGHLLKIWLALKHMGLTEGSPVEIDTSNTTPSLQRLFAYGDPSAGYYLPFAHTMRYLRMEHDAARSIVQTNIRRWAESGSVVTCDPTGYLDFSPLPNGKVRVCTGRRYPLGLGLGRSGFAIEDGVRVAVPIGAFSVWYGRQTPVPGDSEPGSFLTDSMLRELHITPPERTALFVEDSPTIGTSPQPLTPEQIRSACERYIAGAERPAALHVQEEFADHARRIRSMSSNLELPTWMRTSPEATLKALLHAGAKALLLYGPPRTGKTRIIDQLVARNDASRCTVQIHDGWGYDHLVEGLKPDPDGQWKWHDGPLKTAIEEGKSFIVLEEINRTAITQALGEVFSLIEESYRGEEHAITLRSGRSFSIPRNVVFVMTMNTVDKSTEEVDDALIGRVASVEFPPRAEDLNSMLAANGVPSLLRPKLAQLYAAIQSTYPLGHGYFAGLSSDETDSTVILYYRSRVRPVLINFLGQLKQQELAAIDNLVDELFGKT